MNNPQHFEQETKNLDIVISHLRNHKKKSNNNRPDIKTLYSDINTIVSDLDSSIQSCKKYNEAKIHRKYEILVSEMENKIQYLEKKVKEERKARSPSKKYIEDLLEKLISLEKNNDELTRQIKQMKSANEELKKKIYIYENDQHSNQDKVPDSPTATRVQASKPRLESFVNQPISFSLADEINSFLKLKHELRRHQNQQKTSFQRFLVKNKEKIHAWTMRHFLQTIDKWYVEQREYLQRQMYSSTISQRQKLGQGKFIKVGTGIKDRNIFSNTLSFSRNNRRENKKQLLHLPRSMKGQNISQKKISTANQREYKDILR